MKRHTPFIRFSDSREVRARSPLSFTDADPSHLDNVILNLLKPRKYYYYHLMSVDFLNSYYNSSGEACPDFEVHPTPTSQALMASLGLLFQPRATGFSVLYNGLRRQELLDFLRRQAQPSENEVESSPNEDRQYWTRLSFVLSLSNPYFLNFTDLPPKVAPTVFNLYFSNQQARRTAHGVVLNPGEYVDARASGQEVLRVAPIQVTVEVDGDDDAVKVLDIAGDTVMCRPRCIPVSLLAQGGNPNNISCEDVRRLPPESPRDEECRDVIYLDFDHLPEDKYIIEKVGSSLASPAEESPILQTSSYPTPLCFIDLLFSNPTPHQGRRSGVYPVQNLDPDPVESPPSNARIVPISYHLRFRQRSTYWTYFIVPQPQGRSLEDLRIEQLPMGSGSPAPEPVEFLGPCRVHLANGQIAYRFLSKTPVPLQEQSTYYFRLYGRLEGSQHEGVLFDRLPVASIEHVIPAKERKACLQLKASLCPGSSDDPACHKLVTFLCQMARRDPVVARKYLYFSDMFVYV